MLKVKTEKEIDRYQIVCVRCPPDDAGKIGIKRVAVRILPKEKAQAAFAIKEQMEIGA